MSSGRSAKIICAGNSFWVTPRQFWRWVREGFIVFVSEPPLVGAYRGTREDFLVTFNHTVLNYACPEHLHAARQAQKTRRKFRSPR